jgi:type IV secretory pathway TrbD component
VINANDGAREEHVVHASLYRPVLLAGAEPAIVIVEVSTAFALVFGIGLYAATILLATLYLTVVHGLMVWVAKQDAHMIALYVRSLAGADFYAPHADIHAPSPSVKPSMARGA